MICKPGYVWNGTTCVKLVVGVNPYLANTSYHAKIKTPDKNKKSKEDKDIEELFKADKENLNNKSKKEKAINTKFVEQPVPITPKEEDIVPAWKEPDALDENILEFIDPTGGLSWDDARRAKEEWDNSKNTLPTLNQAVDMFGAVPALGKLGKLKYVSSAPGALKIAYKYFPWQSIINNIDGFQDIYKDNVNNQENNTSKEHDVNFLDAGPKYVFGGPLNDKTNHGKLLQSVYASALGRYYNNGGQFNTPYSLPEDNFKKGAKNLHNSVYASSLEQYPGIYNFGGNLSTRQQMYMPLDHIERLGGNYYPDGGLLTFAKKVKEYQKNLIEKAKENEDKAIESNRLDERFKNVTLNPIKEKLKPNDSVTPASTTNVEIIHQNTKLDDKVSLEDREKQFNKIVQNLLITGDAARILKDKYFDKNNTKTLEELTREALTTDPNFFNKIEQHKEKEFKEAEQKEYDEASLLKKGANAVSAFMADPILTGANAMSGQRPLMYQSGALRDNTNPNQHFYKKVTGADNNPINDFVNIFNPGHYGTLIGVANSQGNYGQAYLHLAEGLMAGEDIKGLSEFAVKSPEILNNVSRYVIENTNLKNAYKYNPLAKGNKLNPFDVDRYYRQVYSEGIPDNPLAVLHSEDKTGVSNFVNSVISPPEKFIFPDNTTANFNVLNSNSDLPYFNKSKPYYDQNIFTNQKAQEYLLENKIPMKDYEDMFPAATRYFSTNPEEVVNALKMSGDIRALNVLKPELKDLENYTLYKKHWLKGYVPIKRLGGSILSMSNTPQLEGAKKDLTVPENAYIYTEGGNLNNENMTLAEKYKVDEDNPTLPKNVNEATAYIYKAVVDNINRAKAEGRIPADANLNAMGITAQILFESGNGTSTLSSKYNNFGGLKAFGNWKGDTVELNGVKWRKYATPEEGLAAQIDVYLNNPKYAENGVFQAKTPEEHLKAVAKAGYAGGEENYVKNVMGMVHSIPSRLKKVKGFSLDTPQGTTQSTEQVVETPQLPQTPQETEQSFSTEKMPLLSLEGLNLKSTISEEHPTVQGMYNNLDYSTVDKPTKEEINVANQQQKILNSPISSQAKAGWFGSGKSLFMNQKRDGGSIHIKPENKGKFTASANHAGMGVQEFANHVLANKEDYSSTLVKRANFAHNAAGWHHAMGGPMEQLTEFNEGGKHEENPLGGVPQGTAPDGQPNLVEQGETKLNSDNYIFSDTLKVDKDIAESFNLPKSSVGKTFATVSKSLNKPNSRREFDSIEQNDIKKNLDKLMNAQEAFKQSQVQQKLQEINSLDPSLLSGLMQAQQPQIPQQPIEQPVDPSMMEGQQMDFGGWLRDNKQGVLGGLQAAAGIGAMFIPGGQGIGANLIGGGAKNIIGDIQAQGLQNNNQQPNIPLGMTFEAGGHMYSGVDEPTGYMDFVPKPLKPLEVPDYNFNTGYTQGIPNYLLNNNYSLDTKPETKKQGNYSDVDLEAINRDISVDQSPLNVLGNIAPIAYNSYMALKQPKKTKVSDFYKDVEALRPDYTAAENEAKNTYAQMQNSLRNAGLGAGSYVSNMQQANIAKDRAMSDIMMAEENAYQQNKQQVNMLNTQNLLAAKEKMMKYNWAMDAARQEHGKEAINQFKDSQNVNLQNELAASYASLGAPDITKFTNWGYNPFLKKAFQKSK